MEVFCEPEPKKLGIATALLGKIIIRNIKCE